MTPDPPRLLLITDPSMADPAREPAILDALTQAAGAGPIHILARFPSLPARQGFDLARRLIERLRPLGAGVLLHERADAALAAGADGLHLPGSGLPTAIARRLLGPSRLLGRSCHDVAGARHALADGADYVTLSPLFPTASHPGAPALGETRFAQMRAAIDGHVLALGGVSAQNATRAHACGADGAAMIRGIQQAPNPRQAAQSVLSLWPNLP